MAKSGDVQPPVTPNLLGLLALRQHRQNQAAGINHVTSQVLVMLQAYQQRVKQETSRYAQAAFLNGVIKDRRAKFKAIQAEIIAETDHEKRLELLEEAITIELEISKVVETLKTIDQARW